MLARHISSTGHEIYTRTPRIAIDRRRRLSEYRWRDRLPPDVLFRYYCAPRGICSLIRYAYRIFVSQLAHVSIRHFSYSFIDKNTRTRCSDSFFVPPPPPRKLKRSVTRGGTACVYRQYESRITCCCRTLSICNFRPLFSVSPAAFNTITV